jgi:hypothetical protein
MIKAAQAEDRLYCMAARARTGAWFPRPITSQSLHSSKYLLRLNDMERCHRLIPIAVLIVYVTINVPVRGMHHHGRCEKSDHPATSGWAAFSDADGDADHCGCLLCGFMHLAQSASAIVWTIGPVAKAPKSPLIEPVSTPHSPATTVHSPRGPPSA